MQARVPLLRFAAAAALCASPPPAQQIIHTLSGLSADSFGQVVDLIGDTDGDGRAEILVGAWRDDNGALVDAGSCFFFDGATGLLLTNVFGTGANDHVGYGSSSAGDVNGDGFFDSCVAGDEDDIPGVGNNAGSAVIVSGLDGSPLFVVTGDSGADLFGWSTAAVGDVNGDGFDDVSIGALLDEGGGSPSNAGSVTIVSGADGSVLHKVYGTVANGSLGSHVGRAGDVNGDGFDDFIAARGSRAYVYSGATGAVLYNLTNGANGMVAGGVDTNLDGFDDLIVGTRGGTGRVRVYSGADGAVLYDLTGASGDNLGSCVLGAGDLDGDGYGDFVAGSTGDDDGGGQSGSIRAFSGRDGSEIATIAGTQANQRLGHACGGGHDVDGDGVADVVVSSLSPARALVVSFVPQGVEIFGTGTPGCSGPQDIGANGAPRVGDAGFAIHSSNAPAGLPASMFLSVTADPAGVPVLGALLHASPFSPVFVAVPTPAADAKGSLAAGLPIPANPALIGGVLVVQIATIWPSGPCATPLSTSRGMRITIQAPPV